MKKWNLLSKVTDLDNSKIIETLLENRGIKKGKQTKEFLNPSLSEISVSSVGIDKTQISKSIKRINKAISTKEQIIIFGDYDVDGVCAAAILWETLSKLGANVMPYIPSRLEEGYGLSKKGIDNLILKYKKIDLIITVDNGIVANDAVDYAQKKGIDVIITDHHAAAKKLPKSFSIIHTTSLCGTGVAYIVSKEIKKEKIETADNHLELVVLATIADLVPLIGANRTLVKYGIKKLRETKRLGLLSLFEKSAINKYQIGVYEIGHIIAPRINAMGRLDNAMDSLRLICTNDKKRANTLANQLSVTNLERRRITEESILHAKAKVAGNKDLKNLIFIADESYQQGVIGLIAGRLVEEYYLPSIVISKGEKYSKASVRSVKGFNIIEFLREASDLLVDVGGHPMAAGFTVENKNLEFLEKKLYKLAAGLIKEEYLERVLNIDLELMDKHINLDTYKNIQKLAPFGMANPEPLFKTSDLRVLETRIIGKEGKHLKLNLSSLDGLNFEAILFGFKELPKVGNIISAVFTLDVNEWNGKQKLQLKIKDIKI